uniref:Uncharacterized protein n=1 Tax=Ditylenchus dipsaci TaxID=166011 RepID=A0A915CT54_9BILA
MVDQSTYKYFNGGAWQQWQNLQTCYGPAPRTISSYPMHLPSIRTKFNSISFQPAKIILISKNDYVSVCSSTAISDAIIPAIGSSISQSDALTVILFTSSEPESCSLSSLLSAAASAKPDGLVAAQYSPV